MKLCPFADDVWFWAMAVLQHTKIHNIGLKKGAKIDLKYSPKSQEGYCLARINTMGECLNDKQICNVFSKYSDLNKLILKENKDLVAVNGKYYKSSYFIIFLKKFFKKIKNILRY